jgi:16S rRNA processing protein RimM
MIGKIVGVHGTRGTNKIRSYAESLSVFATGRCMQARTADGRAMRLEINWVKPHGRTPLVSFQGVSDRSQAEALIGAELFISRAELPVLDEDDYYWADLIGMAVYTTGDEYLGRLESIIETGSNDVYVVKDDRTEVLIPALASVVRSVDVKGRRMTVALPEGLV